MPFAFRGFESNVLTKCGEHIQSSGLKGEYKKGDQGPSMVIHKVLLRRGGAGSDSRLRPEGRGKRIRGPVFEHGLPFGDGLIFIEMVDNRPSLLKWRAFTALSD